MNDKNSPTKKWGVRLKRRHIDIQSSIVDHSKCRESAHLFRPIGPIVIAYFDVFAGGGNDCRQAALPRLHKHLLSQDRGVQVTLQIGFGETRVPGKYMASNH